MLTHIQALTHKSVICNHCQLINSIWSNISTHHMSNLTSYINTKSFNKICKYAKQSQTDKQWKRAVKRCCNLTQDLTTTSLHKMRKRFWRFPNHTIATNGLRHYWQTNIQFRFACFFCICWNSLELFKDNVNRWFATSTQSSQNYVVGV